MNNNKLTSTEALNKWMIGVEKKLVNLQEQINEISNGRMVK